MKSPYCPRNLIICQNFILNYINSQVLQNQVVVSKLLLMIRNMKLHNHGSQSIQQSFLFTYPRTFLTSKPRKYLLIE